MYQIKIETPFSRPYRQLTGIGERIRNIYLYKYMSLNTAITALEQNTLRFCVPSSWSDPYESRFYDADYKNVVGANSVNRELYACCIAKNSSSEAAWKMYTNDYTKNPCVQFVICIGQLRKFLENYADQNNCSLYEGEVSYLKDSIINTFHLKSSSYYDMFFKDFDLIKYLNLMLIKRPAFEYEGEIRYFLQSNVPGCTKDFVDVTIPWTLCIKKIVVSDNFKGEYFEKLQKAVDVNVQKCAKDYPTYYYNVPSRLSKANIIYEPIKQIIIE